MLPRLKGDVFDGAPDGDMAHAEPRGDGPKAKTFTTPGARLRVVKNPRSRHHAAAPSVGSTDGRTRPVPNSDGGASSPLACKAARIAGAISAGSRLRLCQFETAAGVRLTIFATSAVPPRARMTSVAVESLDINGMLYNGPLEVKRDKRECGNFNPEGLNQRHVGA